MRSVQRLDCFSWTIFYVPQDEPFQDSVTLVYFQVRPRRRVRAHGTQMPAMPATLVGSEKIRSQMPAKTMGNTGHCGRTSFSVP
jgi:hypothetical protein